MTTPIEKAIDKATYGPWGVSKTVHYKGYEFVCAPQDVESYESPKTFVVQPIGYIDELPKITGFRRNTEHQWYTAKTTNHDTILTQFLTAFDQVIDTPENTMYHNKPAQKE